MCLCGMLASSHRTLPAGVQAEVDGFFADQTSWLGRILRDGRQAGEFRFEGKPEATAETLLAGLEGAMLVARARRDVAHFARIALRLVGALTTGA